MKIFSVDGNTAEYEMAMSCKNDGQEYITVAVSIPIELPIQDNTILGGFGCDGGNEVEIWGENITLDVTLNAHLAYWIYLSAIRDFDVLYKRGLLLITGKVDHTIWLKENNNKNDFKKEKGYKND